MCKLSHYGNCDEETKNNEYCIFHKPNKNEDEAREFYEKFLKRFKHHKEKIAIGKKLRYIFREKMYCAGFIFPEIPEDIDFSFEYAIFEKEVSFLKAIFEGETRFVGTTFKDQITFYETIFEGYVAFGEPLSKTIFEKMVWFNKTIFKKIVKFDAVFKEFVYFVGTAFEKPVSFGDFLSITIFEKDVKFEGASFKESVIFGAIFKEAVGFRRVTFGDFADFSIKKDEKYKFYNKLTFLSVTFNGGVNIDIPSEWFKLPQAEAEARRVQRLFYEKEGRRDDADRMFLRERRALRKIKKQEMKNRLEKMLKIILHLSKIKEIFKKAINEEDKERQKNVLLYFPHTILSILGIGVEFFLADLTCEYGTNWRRAILLWSGVVLALFPFLYFISNGVKVGSFLDYFYFSIVTATTLGYGDFHPIGIGKILASVEAIFGTFMWAVYIAVFARKYMR
ncbi:MAG: pentapeptide repeat-containing protein [Thermoplasmata archaeon]|nr:pentapeptide repeat-containing protein [Thermoplasmata archaeon]